MRFKKIIALMMAASFALTACQGGTVVDDNNEDNTAVVQNIEENRYEAVGTVMEIDGNKIHVLTGDVADIFEVTDKSAKEIYLGEEVSIEKLKNGDLEASAYIQESFSTRHTNMGHIIGEIEGTVKKIQVEDEEVNVIFETENGEEKVILYGDDEIEIGRKYVVDTINIGGDGNSIIAIYDVESIVQVTVERIQRAENGTLMVEAKDDSDMKYIFGISFEDINFNLSELAKGDKLDVYATVLMESYPVQVEANRIYKVK